MADFDWLVSSDARRWLALVAEEPVITPRLVERLRRDLSAARASLVVEQVELRRRARDKFALADQLFFTRRSLEQATDDLLAAVKAERYPPGSRVIDVCCGVGGDLMALAGRGPVTGVDRDPLLCRLAEANLAVVFEVARGGAASDHEEDEPNGHGGNEVLVEEAAAICWKDGEAWHIDPDRRADGARTTRAELFQPPRELLEEWLASGRPGGIKVAPATNWLGSPGSLPLARSITTDARLLVQQSPAAAVPIERQWLGSRGECRQQMIWCGTAARYPGRKTVTVADRGTVARTLVERPGPAPTPTPTRQLGDYVIEAHAAVLAAGLTGSLAAELGIHEFPSVHGYLSSSQLFDDPLVSSYRVVEQMPLDRRSVKQWLRARGVGRVTVKKRGVEVEPQQLARDWSGPGEQPATVIICRWLERTIAIVADPVS